MAVAIYSVADPQQVAAAGVQPQDGMVTSIPIVQNGSSNNPYLVKVENIQPLDAYADPYNIYAFQNTQGVAMDIVSNELIYGKSWEKMSVFTHITQLDAFARVRC